VNWKRLSSLLGFQQGGGVVVSRRITKPENSTSLQRIRRKSYGGHASVSGQRLWRMGMGLCTSRRRSDSAFCTLLISISVFCSLRVRFRTLGLFIHHGILADDRSGLLFRPKNRRFLALNGETVLLMQARDTEANATNRPPARERERESNRTSFKLPRSRNLSLDSRQTPH